MGWDEVAAAFGALGGVLENVRYGEGPRGPGLFVCDPSRPARVFAPASLLFPAKQLCLTEAGVALSQEAAASPAVRDFYSLYYDSLSWGGAGEADCAAFLTARAAMAPDLDRFLADELSSKALAASPLRQNVFARFKASRSIGLAKVSTMMPVVDLINHAPGGTAYETKTGVAVSGHFPDEILARYSASDALEVMKVWGFASRQPRVYSLPLALNAGGKAIFLRRLISKSKTREDWRGPEATPLYRAVSVSHLLLADHRIPERPRAIFAALMKEAEIEAPATLFDEICERNREKLARLAALLEDRAPDDPWRKACAYQREALG